MARYIDADKLIKGLELSIKSWSADCNSNAPAKVTTYKDVLHRVKNLPTADVVEVVRCKDCEYWEEITLDNTEGYFSPEELLGLPFRLPIRSLGEGICQCEHWEGRVVDDKFLAFVEQLITTANDFCSFGERKK